VSIERDARNVVPVNSASATWLLTGTILWGIGVASAFIVLQIAVTLFLVLRGRADVSPSQLASLLQSAQNDGFVLAVNTIVTAAVCVPLILGIAALKRQSRIKDYFALEPVPLRALAWWLGSLIVFIALSDALTALLGKPVVPAFMRATYASSHPGWLFWLALVVAAPLFEETFFRGFLYKGFAASALGPVAAIAITAGLWAAIHLQYDFYGMVSIFFLGLFLGAARSLSESLVVPVLLHAASNVVAIAEAAWLQN